MHHTHCRSADLVDQILLHLQLQVRVDALLFDPVFNLLSKLGVCDVLRVHEILSIVHFGFRI